MNKKEFYNEFKELCEYYNSKIYENKKITKMYYEKVKGICLDDFKKMCEDFIRNYKFMPKVADFVMTNNTGHKGRIYGKDFLESFYDIGG